MPAAATTPTAAGYLRSAIECWEAEIKELTALGVRDGSIVTSTNGNGYEQRHWVNGAKRTYVSKKRLGEWQAEIERGRTVAELRQKIATAQSLVGA